VSPAPIVCLLRVTGYIPEWVSTTAGVPQIAGDLMQRCKSAALGHKRAFRRLAPLFGKLTVFSVTTGFAARNPMPLETSDRFGAERAFRATLVLSRSIGNSVEKPTSKHFSKTIKDQDA
jgi:hypothetical protein